MDKEKVLQNLNSFFETDMKIKEVLIKLAPNDMDEYNEESRMNYIEKLDKELDYIQFEMQGILKNFKLGECAQTAINQYFTQIKNKLLLDKYQQGICHEIYSKYFANMDANFVECVKEECVGYTLTKDLSNLINKSTTINELLHAIHSYITNDEQILKAVSVLGQKEKDEETSITLRGEENELAKKIFEDFPMKMNCGSTDIISLKDKILMMVRDRGHALTIEIETLNQSEVDVRYFIPKICNQSMVEKLPGINSSSITKSGANGFFVSSKEELTKDLFSFISKVPTDFDMEIFQHRPSDMSEKLPYETEEIPSDMPKAIFTVQDVKEIATEKGIKGRLFSKIEEIQKRLKSMFDKTKDKRGNSR